MKLNFTNAIGFMIAGSILLTGCQSGVPNPEKTATNSTTEQTTTTPSTNENIYPNRTAKVGQNYGQMTLEKIGDLTKHDDDSTYAFFKGPVTVSGTYEYFQKDEAFDLGDRVCFTVNDQDEIKKIPQSQFFYEMDKTSPSRFFCFTNNDLAKKLFGTAAGVGKATITISSLNDVIDMEGEVFDKAVLENIITKSAPEAKNDFKEINTKSITWNGKTYKFSHSCNGEIKTGKLFGGIDEVKFCLGENNLYLTDSTNKVTNLASGTELNIANAPVFLDTELLPNSAEGTVLISYSAETCTTTDDCGVGMPTNYVTMAVNLKNETSRNLKNYPAVGNAIWNSSATKAIFVTDSCGGAGCDLYPLTGYNLTTDFSNANLTSESAVGLSPNTPPLNPRDANGKKLAYWKNVTWTSATQFKATLVSPDGKEKSITGTF